MRTYQHFLTATLDIIKAHLLVVLGAFVILILATVYVDSTPPFSPRSLRNALETSDAQEIVLKWADEIIFSKAWSTDQLTADRRGPKGFIIKNQKFKIPLKAVAVDDLFVSILNTDSEGPTSIFVSNRYRSGLLISRSNTYTIDHGFVEFIGERLAIYSYN